MSAPALRTPGQLVNICVGSFGTQFAWALQGANVSAIYEFLGATPEILPLLWLAGPICGLLVQPTIGYLSDRTWVPGLGRRRPYFLGGAIVCVLALVAMPNATQLWMAVGTLWVLDAAINITIEPYRAFVAEQVPLQQRARGFAVQSLFVGLGAIVASCLPWLVAWVWPSSLVPVAGAAVPTNVKIAFYLGATILFLSILRTVLSTQETRPSDRVGATETERGFLKTLWSAWQQLPPACLPLIRVQLLTWMGIFCVFLFFAPAVGHEIFGGTNQQSPEYAAGIAWAGVAIACYNLACMATSLLLPRLVGLLGAARTHALCLTIGGFGVMALAVVRDRYWLLLPFSGFGVAWASVLTVPYTLLAAAVPLEQLGLFLGIFNAFVTLPQLVVSLGMGWVLKFFLGGNYLWATVFGGAFLLLAAIAALSLEDVVSPAAEPVAWKTELAERT